MFFPHADSRLQLLADKWHQSQKDQEEFRNTGGFYNAFQDFVGPGHKPEN
jgi:hypothetical protein